MTTEYAARKNGRPMNTSSILHHPDEEREALPPARTAPAYDRQRSVGGAVRPASERLGGSGRNYYGPKPLAPHGFDHDAHPSGAAGWWDYAKAEAGALRGAAGLIDATAFHKHLVRGPGGDGVPRRVHLQQAAEGRADQP